MGTALAGASSCPCLIRRNYVNFRGPLRRWPGGAAEEGISGSRLAGSWCYRVEEGRPARGRSKKAPPAHPRFFVSALARADPAGWPCKPAAQGSGLWSTGRRAVVAGRRFANPGRARAAGPEDGAGRAGGPGRARAAGASLSEGLVPLAPLTAVRVARQRVRLKIQRARAAVRVEPPREHAHVGLRWFARAARSVPRPGAPLQTSASAAVCGASLRPRPAVKDA